MKFHVRIKPFVSAGEVFVHGDGKTFEILPLSVFPSGPNTIVRIGRSTYWFDGASGGYDGPEFCCRMTTEAEGTALAEMLGRCKDNRGRAPTESYFEPGTRGYHNEIALWPSKPELHGVLIGEPPKPPMIFSRACDCGWMLPRIIRTSDPSVKIEVECPRCGKEWKGSEMEAPRS